MVKLPHSRITKSWPQRNLKTHSIQPLNPGITNSKLKFQNPNNKEKNPKRIQRMKNTLSQEEHQSEQQQTFHLSNQTVH